MTPTPAAIRDTLLDHLPAVVYVADARDKTVYVSPQVERLLGTPPDVWRDDPEAWARHIHPEDRQHVRDAADESRRRGTRFRCEYRMLRADGAVVWMLDEATQLRDADGRVVATHGVALDITERKQAEAAAAARARELRTLYRISEIALADPPLEEAYREIVETICEATGFPMAAITLYEAADGTATCMCTRNLPPAIRGLTFRIGAEDTFSATVIRTGQPFVWTSAEPRPAHLPETLRALDIQTFLGVPLTVRGRVIGVLELADAQPRAIETPEVDLVASIGNHVAALTERARTREALQSGERQFHAVFDATLDAMLIIDDTRIYVAVNPAAARLFGTPVAQLLGHRFGDFAAPGTDVEHYWAAVRDGRAGAGEWSLVRPDGSVRVVESAITSNFLPGRHLCVIRDLTDSKRAIADSRVQAAALTAAANGIVITDAEGRIEWVNPEFTRMTGYTLHEVRGRTPSTLKSGYHDAAFYGELWRAVRQGGVWRGEMINRRKDGSVYHEEQSITPVLEDGPTGRIGHFVAVKQDISERKRANEALRSSEEYHRSLIENALDIIVVLDADGIIRYASPSVERILGDPPDALVGTSGLLRLHPEDFEAISTLFFSGQRTPGFTASAEYRFRHRDGSWRTMEGVGRNLLDHPSVAGIIVNARDVTDRRRDDETQRRLRQQLTHSEKLAAMSELLAGVAHELNNPLSVVIGHTALLARAAEPGVAARADKIGRAAERCGRIVKNFLALARQYPPERISVSLNEAVRDALEVMAYALRVDNVQVATELDRDLPSLSADAHQLQQVIVNLVTNAHQAMRTVGTPRRLTLRTGVDRAAGDVWLEVADSGPGIPPDLEARLFEPFFTTKPVGQGTGLGLSICQGIVGSHGGRLDVEGGAGHGATFRVVLPIGQPAPAAPSSEDQGPILPPRRILVVDDEAEIAAVVCEVLRSDGHEVATAADGAEALTRLQERRYDAVVSDIKMPNMDGPTLWHAVKDRDARLAERFVFFTGDTLSSSTAEFLARSGAPSLKKPFTVRDVRVALSRVPAPDPAGSG